MDQLTFQANEEIFHQGAYAETMFEVVAGKVGIYAEYGSKDERQLATMDTGEIFGEMGLVEFYPRSATAVALENDTVVNEINFDEFSEYMQNQPDKVLSIMRQLSARLRETDAKYLEARRAVFEAVEVERAGKKRSGSLRAKLSAMIEHFRSSNVGA